MVRPKRSLMWSVSESADNNKLVRPIDDVRLLIITPLTKP